MSELHPLIRIDTVEHMVEDVRYVGVLVESALVCRCGSEPTVKLPDPECDGQFFYACADCAERLIW